MKVLVLGCKGQLGLCLRDQLEHATHEVVFASRDHIDVADFNVTKSSICEISPDIVINATAYTAVDKAEEDKEMANLINHLAVANLAHICSQLGCWLVHVSTDYVFDGASTAAYKEEDKTNPQGVYGDTKLKGELAIQSSECRHIIIRTAWVFSEYGNNFLKTMLRLGAERNELRIVGDQVGCPTYAQDIAKAIMTILERLQSKEVSSCLYHFAGNFCCSWAEFSQAIFDKAFELEVIESKPNVVAITTKEFPTLAKRPARSELSSKRIRATFGIDPSDCMVGIRSSLMAIKMEHIKK
ncbi:MAG: dTDP-4-dehydrorhamnose reductase [Proteobacteria bacterium]|nr:dTDP-4-dehydrorhamnose reductase [Pseudomonadota bacterium]MDA0843610.1 dTDP-4-dehydrorhamnose reductase [Bacteroidota bacterium]